MKTRRNQPESTPHGRFRCTPVERLATTFTNGRRTTGFTILLPAGVLARLLARKKRHSRPKSGGLTSQRPMHVPHARWISRLKSRP